MHSGGIIFKLPQNKKINNIKLGLLNKCKIAAPFNNLVIPEMMSNGI